MWFPFLLKFSLSVVLCLTSPFSCCLLGEVTLSFWRTPSGLSHVALTQQDAFLLQTEQEKVSVLIFLKAILIKYVKVFTSAVV